MSKKARKLRARSRGAAPKHPSPNSTSYHRAKKQVTTKQQLSPFVAAIVLLPILALGAIAVLWVLNDSSSSSSGYDELAQVLRDRSGSAAQSRGKSSNYIWAKNDKDVWTTVSDQKEKWNQIDNPATDGWQTEVITENVTKQWKKIQNIITRDRPIESGVLESLVTEELAIDSLLPENLKRVFENEEIVVRRGDLETGEIASTNHSNGTAKRGAAGLASTLRDLVAPYSDRGQLRIKLKVLKVNQTANSVSTHQTLELFGPTRDGLREENAIWIAEWTGEEHPRLKSIALKEYESIDSRGDVLFADCTESVLGHTDSYRRQLMKGYDYWLERSQVNSFFNLIGNNGIAVGDVNGDGLQDVYACQEVGLPNLLYLQNPDGTLRDASAESGVDFLQNSSSALILDFNNDGNKDMAVAVTGGVVISEGDGEGHFSRRAVLDTGDNIWSLSSADYDQDGFLDLYVGVYLPDGVSDQPQTVVNTNSKDEWSKAGDNGLYRNELATGSWKFRDVTDECGLDVNNGRFTFAASWEDYDNDGDQDLYVANDYGWNNLYRNDRRADGSVIFTDVADATNAKDSAFGMSVSWSDYDHNGWMDAYISNMFSYAGHRITFQDQFKSSASIEEKRSIQRFARGNTLLRNLGLMASGESSPEAASDDSNVIFEDVSTDAGVNRGRWAWGSCFIDINNDGWDDLFTTNGLITASDTGDL